jgi:hypothetical protein
MGGYIEGMAIVCLSLIHYQIQNSLDPAGWFKF